MIISKKISSSIAETLSANNIISWAGNSYLFLLSWLYYRIVFPVYICSLIWCVFTQTAWNTYIFGCFYTTSLFRRRISCIHSKTVCHTFTYHLCICALFRCNILRTYMAMDCCLCNITVCNSCFIPCRHQKQTYDSWAKNFAKKTLPAVLRYLNNTLHIFLFTQPAKIIRNTCHMYVDKFNKYCSRIIF